MFNCLTARVIQQIFYFTIQLEKEIYHKLGYQNTITPSLSSPIMSQDESRQTSTLKRLFQKATLLLLDLWESVLTITTLTSSYFKPKQYFKPSTTFWCGFKKQKIGNLTSTYKRLFYITKYYTTVKKDTLVWKVKDYVKKKQCVTELTHGTPSLEIKTHMHKMIKKDINQQQLLLVCGLQGDFFYTANMGDC